MKIKILLKLTIAVALSFYLGWTGEKLTQKKLVGRVMADCAWVTTGCGSGCIDNKDLYNCGHVGKADVRPANDPNSQEAMDALNKALNGVDGVQLPQDVLNQIGRGNQGGGSGGEVNNNPMCEGSGDLRNCLVSSSGIYTSGEVCAGKTGAEYIQCGIDNGFTIQVCAGSQETAGEKAGEFTSCVSGEAALTAATGGCGQIDLCKDGDCGTNFIIDKSTCNGGGGGGDTPSTPKTPKAACMYVRIYTKNAEGAYVEVAPADIGSKVKVGDTVRLAVKANSAKYALAKFDINVGGKTTSLTVDANKGKIDDNDPRLKFSSGWGKYSGTDYGYYKDTTHFTKAKNKSVSFKFKDTAVSFYRTVATNRGIMNVYIDNKLVDTVDNYATPSAVQQKKTYSGLTADKDHTLKLVSTGTKNDSSTDSFVDVDAVEVGEAATVPLNDAGKIYVDYVIPSSGSFGVTGSIQ